MEPLIDKWSSFGFAVYECNGHDIADLLANFRKMSKINNKPKVLIAHTIKGKGIPIAESILMWGRMANGEAKIMGRRHRHVDAGFVSLSLGPEKHVQAA